MLATESTIKHPKDIALLQNCKFLPCHNKIIHEQKYESKVFISALIP